MVKETYGNPIRRNARRGFESAVWNLVTLSHVDVVGARGELLDPLVAGRRLPTFAASKRALRLFGARNADAVEVMQAHARKSVGRLEVSRLNEEAEILS
jgi:hypothetical protein